MSDEVEPDGGGNLGRSDLLARTPEIYLADGWLDAAGHLRPDLRGIDATAAVTQLTAAELSPQELGLTVAAVEQLLPEYGDGSPEERLHATLDEALETVARAIQQPNNEGLVQWLNACAAPVGTEPEIAAFVDHLQAVNRQYGVLVSMLPPSASA